MWPRSTAMPSAAWMPMSPGRSTTPCRCSSTPSISPARCSGSTSATTCSAATPTTAVRGRWVCARASKRVCMRSWRSSRARTAATALRRLFRISASLVMDLPMLLHFCRRATALLGLALVPLTPAQATDATPDTLEKVVILKRHGVRAAMSSPERLGRYSLHPWPHFGVPAGHLTANGAQLERLFGDYYRARYTALGLLNGDGCNQAYYWANRTQRTIASAQALASTLTPGCADPVHHVPTGSSDVLFDGTAALRQPQARARMQGRPHRWRCAGLECDPERCARYARTPAAAMRATAVSRAGRAWQAAPDHGTGRAGRCRAVDSRSRWPRRGCLGHHRKPADGLGRWTGLRRAGLAKPGRSHAAARVRPAPGRVRAAVARADRRSPGQHPAGRTPAGHAAARQRCTRRGRCHRRRCAPGGGVRP
ncbi:hypothetical protein XAB3213_4250018 [Xanthomonas citri pv. bilvae]|nr:hypothetical protein XAB3213_4250018 [Xanthomonas citri pv. bilvae]